MNEAEKQVLLRSLEAIKVFVQESWKRFEGNRHPHARSNAVEFYEHIRKEVANSITKHGNY